jgi:hypothetical protein
MKLSIASLISTVLVAFAPVVYAGERILTSSSLNPCMSNSNFSATLFDVAFTPGNRTLNFDVIGVSSITGNVTIDLAVFAYGLQVYTQTIDPCDSEDLSGLCPMNVGQINLQSNAQIPGDQLSKVPGMLLEL